MPPFPLLRLPQLVLCEVFKSLSIGEKIKLSFCSKKISAQINNARLYSQKVVIDLDILNQNIRVLSENNKDTFEIIPSPISGISQNLDTQRFYITGCSVPIISTSTGIQITCKNQQEEFLSAIRYLLKMFPCKISTIISYYNSDLYQPVIFELLDLQLEFKKIVIYLNGSEDQSLLWNQICSNLGLVENLIILPVVNPRFRPVFTSWPQNILITSSAGIILESLLACTSTRITLFQSHLENKDLDVILRKWKAGGFPNLKSLKVYSQNIRRDGAPILGMNVLELRGMVIQTDDGPKEATINTGVGRIEMSVTPFD